MPRNLGWPYPVRARPWPDLDAWYVELAEDDPRLAHLSALVQNIRAVGAEDDLIAFTSLFDLMVRPAPAPEPPYDLIAVRSPVSIATVEDDMVLIDHLTLRVTTIGSDDPSRTPFRCSGDS